MSLKLEQIRAALPTHIMLTPKRHFYAAGDEIFLSEKREWIPADDLYRGEHVLPTRISRRPIPPEVLDNQAFWMLLDGGLPISDHFADTAENLGIVKKLGGLANYRAQRKAGRLYDKWLLEQMEGE